MLRRNAAVKWLLLAVVLVVSQVLGTVGVKAVSATSHYVLLYLDHKEAVVGSETVMLDVPPTIFDGSTYVPARFVGNTLGFSVEWNNDTRTIDMKPRGHEIVLSADKQTIIQDGVNIPFSSVARIVDGTLLVKLTWLADLTGVPYTYNDELRRVEMLVLNNPEGIYIIDQQNSKPVAKFTTSKKVYRPGEPVKYIDLSYDPDAEGLVEFNWKGKQDTFFASGKYTISLEVADAHGNKSAVYSDSILVEGPEYLSEFEYPIYNKPIGSFIKVGWDSYYRYFDQIPELDKTTSYDTSRTLLVSDSPEEIRQPGILYEDTINGKSRLYAHHINLSGKSVTFMVYATNLSDKPVTLTTTNKGEVWPTIYANIMGNEATTEFLNDRTPESKLVIPAGKTYVYSQMPVFLAGQGANVIYDVESNGPLKISFVAQDTANQKPLKDLQYRMELDHVRGTYSSADLAWDLDLNRQLENPMKLQIGNDKSDPFLKGYDAVSKTPSTNYGNWGVKYDIHIKNPPQMGIMLMAKGGIFKGPVKINGEIVLVPQSGVLSAFDGVILLGRTTGKESTLDIEFSPPGASNLPVDIVLYPLRDLD
ncbi:MAG: hypothetical protein K0Q90_585 [Paenibacillaceae bacterium]|jgi:PKD repeat protein|nr:hypothetical protein [Paenibacillaceae bacterium]